MLPPDRAFNRTLPVRGFCLALFSGGGPVSLVL
jgi:hypothetical protein